MSQNDNQSKQLNQGLSQPLTFPVMNFIHDAFDMTAPQTPLVQYMPPPAHQPQGQPSRVTKILEEIRSLKLVIQNNEKIENTVNNMNPKIKELDIKVTHVETRVIEVETSCTFISDKHDKQSRN